MSNEESRHADQRSGEAAPPPDFRAVLEPAPGQTPSLGDRLRARRRELDWTPKRMALRLGVPYETYLRWEADTDLPDVDGLFRIAEVLQTTANRVRRLVKESARRILHETLVAAAGVPTVRAARKRGNSSQDAGERRVRNLPVALQRRLADDGSLAADDAAAVAGRLRDMAALDEKARRIRVEGLLAELSLEGEDQLPEVVL